MMILMSVILLTGFFFVIFVAFGFATRNWVGPLVLKVLGNPMSLNAKLISIRGSSIMVIAGIASFGISVLSVPYSFWQEGDYWKYEGAYDYWRVPLGHPYQLACGDVTENCWIDKWEESESYSPDLVSGINEVTQVDSIVIGLGRPTMTEDLTVRWFALNAITGDLQFYPDGNSFASALDSLGLDSIPRLKSIHRFIRDYWKIH